MNFLFNWFQKNEVSKKQFISLKSLSYLWLKDSSATQFATQDDENTFKETLTGKSPFQNTEILLFWESLIKSEIFSFKVRSLALMIHKALIFLEKKFDTERKNPQIPSSVTRIRNCLGTHTLLVAQKIFDGSKALPPEKLLELVVAALCHDFGYALDGYSIHQAGSLGWLESALVEDSNDYDFTDVFQAIKSHHTKPFPEAPKLIKALYLANEECLEEELSKKETQTEPAPAPAPSPDTPPPKKEENKRMDLQTLKNDFFFSDSDDEQGKINKLFLWEGRVFFQAKAFEESDLIKDFSGKNPEKSTYVLKFLSKISAPSQKTILRGLYYVFDEKDVPDVVKELDLPEGLENHFVKLTKVESKT